MYIREGAPLSAPTAAIFMWPTKPPVKTGTLRVECLQVQCCSLTCKNMQNMENAVIYIYRAILNL